MTLQAGTEFLSSERLLLRRFTPDDLEFLVALHANAQVARYIGYGRPRSRQESDAWLNAVLQLYREMELGQLAVQRISDGRVIGRCGLWSLYLENDTGLHKPPRAWFSKEEVPADCSVTRIAELGYTFDAEYWGQGYASEAVRCVIDYVRTSRPTEKIVVSLIYPENLRSLKVAAKFNLKLQGVVEGFGQQLLRHDWTI